MQREQAPKTPTSDLEMTPPPHNDSASLQFNAMRISTKGNQSRTSNDNPNTVNIAF